MMRYFLVFFCLLCPAVCIGADVNTKLNWSYGALSDTMKSMRNNCELTHADEFLQMGNWFRNKGAYFSLNELVRQCESQEHSFHNIDRTIVVKGKPKKCQMPTTNCSETSCGERQYTNNKGCNIFISTLMKNNNQRAKIKTSNKPGTYVKRIKLSNGRLAYKVFDVILANGYWKNGKIDSNVNQNENNTKIYEVLENGTVRTLQWHTWTNDMFFDVRASSMSSDGNVGGAFVNSYIYPEEDLTKEIYALYDENRGMVYNTIVNTINSLPEGPYDIKNTYRRRYLVQGQTEVEANTNAVMFGGKIAHLDWLGHLLYGMNRQESIFPNVGANAAAQILSMADGFELNVETGSVQQAWDIGSEVVVRNKKRRDTTFKDTQTRMPRQAFNMAAERMKTIYPDATDVSCSGLCNSVPGTDDIVNCMDAQGRRIEFVFDDICNW